MAEPDPRLVDYLADRNAECSRCGYNLRGCRAARCPECGRVIRIEDFLSRPVWRWLLLPFAWVPLAVYVIALGAWQISGDLGWDSLGLVLLFVLPALVGGSLATYLCVRLVSVRAFYALFACMFVSLCIAVVPVVLWFVFVIMAGGLV